MYTKTGSNKLTELKLQNLKTDITDLTKLSLAKLEERCTEEELGTTQREIERIIKQLEQRLNESQVDTETAQTELATSNNQLADLKQELKNIRNKVKTAEFVFESEQTVRQHLDEDIVQLKAENTGLQKIIKKRILNSMNSREIGQNNHQRLRKEVKTTSRWIPKLAVQSLQYDIATQRTIRPRKTNYTCNGSI